MKKLSVIVLACIIPMLLPAQTSSDPIYGFGAVPEVDGNVVFERHLNVPDNASKTAIFKAVSRWAAERFAKPRVISGTIREMSDKITVNAEEVLTFKKTKFVTDESNINYRLTIDLDDGKCSFRITNINYDYEEHRDGGGLRFTAESWITDKEAFNRRGKMLRTTAKFRVMTINLVNMLESSLNETLSSVTE
ncbi:MAG: DUF4468 domain-containing protein [Bacteroidaceae bacterium]|nr:DUF4468 domain-containing protein [Bacteroidaceae bacterium]